MIRAGHFSDTSDLPRPASTGIVSSQRHALKNMKLLAGPLLPKSSFPVRSENLLSRPDLAAPQPRRAAEGMGGAEPPGATRSALLRASMARMASTGPSPQ